MLIGMKRRYVETGGGQRATWYVERIWELAESLEVQQVDIERIVGLDQVTWFTPENPPTVRSVAEHAKRILECDLSYPVILTEDWRVFDGMHRIARHLMEGKTGIRVVRFETNPEPDLLETLGEPEQPNNPLHGLTLKAILEELVERHGWAELGARINIRCFTQNPSLGSSLKFLRKTPWARAKVERLYLDGLARG
jgi:DNA-binding protein VF530